MKKITGRLIKRIFLGLLIILTILIVMYWDLVSYGIQQGYGQATIIWNARPVEDFITDPTFPDSLKARLKLIDEVRQYAIDSLGMKDTKNYTQLKRNLPGNRSSRSIRFVKSICASRRFFRPNAFPNRKNSSNFRFRSAARNDRSLPVSRKPMRPKISWERRSLWWQISRRRSSWATSRKGCFLRPRTPKGT